MLEFIKVFKNLSVRDENLTKSRVFLKLYRDVCLVGNNCEVTILYPIFLFLVSATLYLTDREIA